MRKTKVWKVLQYGRCGLFGSVYILGLAGYLVYVWIFGVYLDILGMSGYLRYELIFRVCLDMWCI